MAELIGAGDLQLAGDNTHDLPKVPTWHRNSMVIIGDAAHCTNPTAGQGMAMALTDAGALAELVGPALENDVCYLDQSLMAFEAHQWPLNQRLVRSSHVVARLYALRGPAWSRCKIALLRVLANPLAVKLVRPLIASFLNER